MSVMPSGTLYINFKKRPYTKRTLTEENSRCVFDKRIRKREVVGAPQPSMCAGWRCVPTLQFISQAGCCGGAGRLPRVQGQWPLWFALDSICIDTALTLVLGSGRKRDWQTAALRADAFSVLIRCMTGRLSHASWGAASSKSNEGLTLGDEVR